MVESGMSYMLDALFESAMWEGEKVKSALDVARYFLCRIDREAGDTISNLKLQKLVYYAQAWSLVMLDRPLFPERIEAWLHGPVVPSLYQTFKEYRSTAIPRPEEGCPDFNDEETGVLEEVWDSYGDLSARQLEKLTHDEQPWIQARKGIPLTDSSNEEITPDSMKAFYADFLVA